MKKETEKQPIDDLFARRLSNMSLPPSPNGFERLQKRMNQNKPDRRSVFGHNPSLQRYMAVAACLVLVGLFGWFYWQPTAQKMSGVPQVATNATLSRQPQKLVKSQPAQAESIVSSERKNSGQLALVDETTINEQKGLSNTQIGATRKFALPSQSLATAHNEPVTAQIEPIKTKVDAEEMSVHNKPLNEHSAAEQLADNGATAKSNPPAERVLIVTIDEPASLVAARQTAQKFVEEKPALISGDKDEKDAKGGIWNQVRRFKEGELFARHSDRTTDEQGLLDRAYNSLKHSIDKNKPAKQ